MARLKADTRRRHFVDAAMAVISREGIANATTRRIADEAGAPLASLHYCFQTKENLFLAVMEHITNKIQLLKKDIDVDSDDQEAPARKMAAVAEQLLMTAIRWMLDNPEAARAAYEVQLWADRQDPVRSVEITDRSFTTWRENLRSAHAAVDENFLESFTNLIVAFLDGLTTQWNIYGDRDRTLRDATAACVMASSYLEAHVGLVDVV